MAIIIRFSGGLGNQMFQYALYCVLKKRFPDKEFKADLGHYNLYKVHNGFEIDTFFPFTMKRSSFMEVFRYSNRLSPNVNLSFLDPRIWNIIERRLLSKDASSFYYRQKEFNSFEPELFKVVHDNDDLYLEGEWQNYNYFSDEVDTILSVFDPRFAISEDDKFMSDRMNRENSVSIHIRCGDFLGNSAHQLCGREYYRRAINYINQKVDSPHFYAFSDDIDEAGKILDAYNVTYMQDRHEPAIADMWLMSKCKHNIIPNSSFGFWGAFMNRNCKKIVLAPKYFLKKDGKMMNFEGPKEWNYL